MTYKRRYDNRHILLLKGESQRKDGSYTYRWTDAYGKRRTIYSIDLDRLRQREEKIELNKLEGIKEPPAGLTVESLYETWRKLKRGIKTSTNSNYIYLFESIIRPSFGKKRVIQVKRSTVRAFYISLIEERGLALSTLESAHNVLQQVFQYAVDDDILRKNPCTNVLKEIKLTYARYKSKQKDALTLRQEFNFLRFVIESAVYQHWYPTFFIMANSGLRVGELTGLRWQDVDLDNGYIDVNHTLGYFDHRDEKKFYYSISSPKTECGKRRVIITEAVKEAFHMEKEYQKLAGIESVDEIDGYEDFIFINRFGHVQNQGALNKALRRIIRDYNLKLCEKENADPQDALPHFSCHILRHTYATRLIESGANLKFVQTQMGHSEIQTTMDIYVTPTDDFKIKEIQSFENYMEMAFLPTVQNDISINQLAGLLSQTNPTNP